MEVTQDLELQGLMAALQEIRASRPVGFITDVSAGVLSVRGLSRSARLGDQVDIFAASGARLSGEVLRLRPDASIILPAGSLEGVSINDEVHLHGPLRIAPADSWVGRVLDASGRPLDGKLLPRGPKSRPIETGPPNAALRRAIGGRLETGMAVFNTLLPIVRGQRVGLFAGSGVGKSRLLAHFASHMDADVAVIALVGERGRELRDFIENALGAAGMARSIIVAATSDQSPLERRRCALTAMTIAEHFRDQGKQVLYLADSVTRFAEAHREVSVASGEDVSLRGYPASTVHRITSLCERAGPGQDGQGDITAVFSVLVAGSDMEEPIADIVRGVLDGHVVLDRGIAERGRYPAIDAVRSVSRSLPDAASQAENDTISKARRLLGAYDESALMIRSGLYAAGSDPVLDVAVRAFPELDAFVGAMEPGSSSDSFARLSLMLRKAGATEALNFA